jgi:hypothetical protein
MMGIQNSKFKIQNSQTGISIIEVIVSMFMVAALLVVYASAVQVTTLTKKLRYENLAYHVANKQMETLRSTPFGSLPSSGVINDSLLTQIPSGAGSYTITDSGSFSGLKDIVVTVTWNDGIAKQIDLNTIAGAGGINP